MCVVARPARRGARRLVDLGGNARTRFKHKNKNMIFILAIFFFFWQTQINNNKNLHLLMFGVREQDELNVKKLVGMKNSWRYRHLFYKAQLSRLGVQHNKNYTHAR